MAVEVRIPTILRTFTGGAKAVEGDGTRCSQVIDDIDARNPGIKERLVESEEPAPVRQRLRQRRGRPVHRRAECADRRTATWSSCCPAVAGG